MPIVIESDPTDDFFRGLLRLREEASQTIADTVEETRDELEEANPRDTGYSASNWIITVGEPEAMDRVHPFHRDDRLRSLSIGPARNAAGLARLLNYDIMDGTIFINNTVDYIDDLNEGSSDQAPAGWVDEIVALNEARLESRLRVLSTRRV